MVKYLIKNVKSVLLCAEEINQMVKLFDQLAVIWNRVLSEHI